MVTYFKLKSNRKNSMWCGNVHGVLFFDWWHIWFSLLVRDDTDKYNCRFEWKMGLAGRNISLFYQVTPPVSKTKSIFKTNPKLKNQCMSSYHRDEDKIFDTNWLLRQLRCTCYCQALSLLATRKLFSFVKMCLLVICSVKLYRFVDFSKRRKNCKVII